MGLMNVLLDLAQRPIDTLDALPEVSVEQANAHLGGHPNSIAWLLWHTGRMADIQLAALTGEPEVWERFDIALPDSMGYGQAPEEARAIAVDEASLSAVRDYVRATLEAVRDYCATLSDAALDDIVDTNWTPHVSRGVRLVSIIDDAVQHLGAANHLAGVPRG
ncbi:DinB family protein [Corynebacterium striatum]|uniref:DinB-like domain-containing protein n=2 Tax=Corynebacterium striatum TaxID=43770 RepID=A0ABC9ZLX3_CORST|nr:DinB family protein [Corynebacterium striatum]GEA42997.1 hypothetical protein Cst04h_11670 [Corynebacterium striatum]